VDADDEGHQKVAVRMIQKVRAEPTTNYTLHMPFRFVCKYIRMYVFMYVYIFIYIYIVRDTHTHTHKHTHTHTHTHTYNYIGAGD
jgi:hypothetical protein